MNSNTNEDKSKNTKGDGVSFLIRFIAVGLLLFLFPLLYTEYSLNNKKDVSSSVSIESIEASMARLDLISQTIFDGAAGGGGGGHNPNGSGSGEPNYTPTPEQSAPAYDENEYLKSILPQSLCYLTAESYSVLGGTIYKLIKNYYSDLKNNVSLGGRWTHIKEGSKSSGFSWTLWQNKYDTNTYALVYTGTDQIRDTMEYIPMMINENYCEQMDQAIELAKEIKNYAPTDILNLHITGHSLGGYLAAYVTSDLVDKDLANSPHSRITATDIHDKLTINSVRCTTFGSPGFYVGGWKKNALNKLAPVTSWGQFKNNMNSNHAYDNYIMNYINSKDPVGHLFIKPSSFNHLGRTKDYVAKELKFNNKIEFVKKAIKVMGINGLQSLGDIYYHLPHVYHNLLG